MQQTRKIIVISYHYPPKPGIGGVRISGLTKYLARNGWDPIVVTPSSESISIPSYPIRVIETKKKDRLAKFQQLIGQDRIEKNYSNSYVNSSSSYLGRLKLKLESFVKWLITFPDRYYGWGNYALEAINNLLITEQIYAIISSSNPFVAHIIASKIKRKNPQIRWIADFRDLWSQCHYLEISRLQRKIMQLYEKVILRNADILVTISEPLSQILQSFYKTKTVYTILNGFDPDEIVRPSITDKFEIVYTGQFYKGKRDPELLFKAIAGLIKEEKIAPDKIEVNIYGPKVGWIDLLSEKYGLQGIIKQHGIVNRKDVLVYQAKAQMLLLLGWDNPMDYGNYTGKIFEYLLARRPILAIGYSDGVVNDLLRSIGAGKSASTCTQVRDILIEYYNEYLKYGSIRYYADESRLSQYSQIEMGRRYNDLLISL